MLSNFENASDNYASPKDFLFMKRNRILRCLESSPCPNPGGSYSLRQSVHRAAREDCFKSSNG